MSSVSQGKRGDGDEFQTRETNFSAGDKNSVMKEGNKEGNSSQGLTGSLVLDLSETHDLCSAGDTEGRRETGDKFLEFL